MNKTKTIVCPKCRNEQSWSGMESDKRPDLSGKKIATYICSDPDCNWLIPDC
ncbi:MAG: hypothetical protein GTN76_03255 [Candidatus Aenigmarchaeota archaeon]|nr:hypothetical protein [Candidatus Aenigmarchaeota archaeon]